MTAPDFPMPYEVQFTHDGQSIAYMPVLSGQRQAGRHMTQHGLSKGVYLVSLTYNRPKLATLRHAGVGGVAINELPLPSDETSIPRTSRPMKISVETDVEYLHVDSSTSGDRLGRATVSIIPFETYKPA